MFAFNFNQNKNCEAYACLSFVHRHFFSFHRQKHSDAFMCEVKLDAYDFNPGNIIRSKVDEKK